MNDYPIFGFTPMGPHNWQEINEAPQENILGGPVRRVRGQVESVEEHNRRLNTMVQGWLRDFGIQDNEEFDRVIRAITTGDHFNHIQNCTLRERVIRWYNWERE